MLKNKYAGGRRMEEAPFHDFVLLFLIINSTLNFRPAHGTIGTDRIVSGHSLGTLRALMCTAFLACYPRFIIEGLTTGCAVEWKRV